MKYQTNIDALMAYRFVKKTTDAIVGYWHSCVYDNHIKSYSEHRCNYLWHIIFLKRHTCRCTKYDVAGECKGHQIQTWEKDLRWPDIQLLPITCTTWSHTIQTFHGMCRKLAPCHAIIWNLKNIGTTSMQTHFYVHIYTVYVHISHQYQTISNNHKTYISRTPFQSLHTFQKKKSSAIQHPVVSNFRKPRNFTCFHDFLDTSTHLSNPYIVTCLPRDEPRCCHWLVYRDSSLMVCILK